MEASENEYKGILARHYRCRYGKNQDIDDGVDHNYSLSKFIDVFFPT